MSRGAEHFKSFKELDQAWAAPKGTAFRAFKQALPVLTENLDFIRLDAMRAHAEIESLRAANRIYKNSITVVLLTPTGTHKLRHP